MDKERGKVLLSTLYDTLVVLIESLNEESEADKENILHQANLLLDLLETAKKDVGKYDLRFLGGNLCRTIESFFALVSAYDATKNKSKDKSVLKLFWKAYLPLIPSLDLDWNCKLEKPAVLALAGVNEQSRSHNNLTIKLPTEPVEKGDITPKKNENSLRIFELFTPLLKQAESIKCGHCETTFRNTKSVQRHHKKFHPNLPVPKVAHPLGTCKLASKASPGDRCGAKFTRDQMKRHLTDVHKVVFEQDQLLRGFLSIDGGLTWSAVCLKPADPDPVVDIVLQEDEEENDNADEPSTVVEVQEELIRRNLFPADETIQEQLHGIEENIVNDDHDEGTKYSGEETGIRDNSEAVEDTKDNSEQDEEVKGDSEQAEESKDDSEQVEETKDDSEQAEETNNELEHELGNREDIVDKVGVADVNIGQHQDFPEEEMEIDVESDGLETVTVRPPVDKFCSQSSSDSSNNFLDATNNPKMKKVVKISLWNEAIDDMKNIDEDSDIEEGDSESMIQKRFERKSKRWSKRNSSEASNIAMNASKDPANAEIIEDFHKYMAMGSRGKDPSTISKYMGHIVYYPDSYLQFLTDKDQSFKLEMHLKFGESVYRDVTFPLDWVQETTSENPSRCVEKLKAHSEYRQYVNYKSGQSNLSSNEKNTITNYLSGISKEVNAQNLYNKFSVQVNNEHVEKVRAKMTLNPNSSENVANAVKVWNTSETQREIAEEMTKIYEDFVKMGEEKEKKNVNRKFTQFAHWVRFNMVLSDKNRAATYRFRNIDFSSNTQVYFPEDCDFDSLPDGWNLHQPPSPDARPSAWLLTLPASLKSMKGMKPVDCVVTPYTMEWMERYREMKEIVFGEEEDPNQEFFVNYNGRRLSDSETLWRMFETVTGVTKANITTIRKGAEILIRGSEKMTAQIKSLNNHSDAIGKSNYDVTGYKHRTQFAAVAAVKENQTAPPIASVDGDEVEERRQRRRAKDKEIANRNALDILNRDKARKAQVLSIVKHADCRFLQEQLTSSSNTERGKLTGTKFPVDKKWKSVLFRFVDGAELEEEILKRVLDIEHGLFIKVKEEVVKDSGRGWTGDKSQQQMADMKIAFHLKSSFYNYEKSKMSGSKSFFKF